MIPTIAMVFTTMRNNQESIVIAIDIHEKHQ